MNSKGMTSMGGLLFDDLSAYVKDLISRELGDQNNMVDKQKHGNLTRQHSEFDTQPDGPSSNEDAN